MTIKHMQTNFVMVLCIAKSIRIHHVCNGCDESFLCPVFIKHFLCFVFTGPQLKSIWCELESSSSAPQVVVLSGTSLLNAWWCRTNLSLFWKEKGETTIMEKDSWNIWCNVTTILCLQLSSPSLLINFEKSNMSNKTSDIVTWIQIERESDNISA